MSLFSFFFPLSSRNCDVLVFLCIYAMFSLLPKAFPHENNEVGLWSSSCITPLWIVTTASGHAAGNVVQSIPVLLIWVAREYLKSVDYVRSCGSTCAEGCLS